MKWFFNIGCGCIFFVPAYMLVYCLVVLGLNVWKVHLSCSQTRVPEVHDRVVWNAWTNELERAGRLVGVDWSRGVTNEQARLLVRLISNSQLSLRKIDDFPYDFPYDEIRQPKAELYFRSRLVATLTTYYTNDNFWPALVEFAGFSRQFSCGNEYNRAYALYSSKQFNPAFVATDRYFTQ